jgi:hypothetical protein
MFTRQHHDGIGIATGEASGCWAMVINRLEGRQSLRKLIDRYDPLPFGPVMATADSWVWWFAWEPGCAGLQDSFEFAPGLVVRSDGGGLVVPPRLLPMAGCINHRYRARPCPSVASRGAHGPRSGNHGRWSLEPHGRVSYGPSHRSYFMPPVSC